jgi:nucleotide-binding universal stress UspA family protein
LGAELTFLFVSESKTADDLEAFLHREMAGSGHRHVVLKGDPADRIIAFAREESCDLILMPTHAYGRFRRYLLGSVAAKVLHDADCPVWTGVHHEDAPLPDHAVIHSIVCAVDLDDACVPVIGWAEDLAARFNATLKVVHVIPAADQTSDNVGEIALRQYLFREAEDRFAGLRETRKLNTAISFAGGRVAQVVRETALRERADLVVIGRGRTQRTLGRLRTHSYAIIRESPCAVLSV